MITTLAALAAVCLLSLAFILIIPHFAATKVLMRFLPQDIREAAKAHPDPPVGRQMIGYLLTALAAAGYVGVLFLSRGGRDPARLRILAAVRALRAVFVRLQAVRYSGAGSIHCDHQEVLCAILPGNKGMQKLG